MLKIIVITDEPLMEAGIRSLLAAEEFEITGFVRTLGEVQRSAAQNHADVLFCALRGGHEVSLADLRSASPRSAIVVLGREFSPEYAHQALEMGIRGLVNSTAEPDTLRECLRKAGRGELWMENSLSMMLLDTRPLKLSKRQSELIHLLAQGLKNKEIAGILGISEGTVKAYLTALFEKVGAKDRFELALYGLKYLKHVNGQHVMDRLLTRPARGVDGRRGEKVSVA